MPGAAGVTNPGSLPPVLLVIPNAWGRLTRNVLGLCLLALERGYYPVIFHRRGHHGCPLVSPRLQPFGDPSDLKEAVTYIRFRHPAAPLFAVCLRPGGHSGHRQALQEWLPARV